MFLVGQTQRIFNFSNAKISRIFGNYYGSVLNDYLMQLIYSYVLLQNKYIEML